MHSYYSDEFKQEAIEYRARNPGLSIATCARNLKLDYNLYYSWLKKSDIERKAKAKKHLFDEISHIKRELIDAKIEIESLKVKIESLEKTIIVLSESIDF